MSKVVMIVGAGSGLGLSVARQFGREGFRVALVARRQERLDELARRLGEEGIEAAGFSADLSDHRAVPALLGAVRERFGQIDVVEYSPISGDQTFTPAHQLSAAGIQKLSGLLLLSPVEIVRALLPEWTGRGDGAFLLTQGFSAAHAVPHMSGLGPLMAATRNWLHSLHGELVGTGVYAGTLTIAVMIAGSEMGEAAAAAVGSQELIVDGLTIPLTDPDMLAARLWDLYFKRDRVEQFYPESLSAR